MMFSPNSSVSVKKSCLILILLALGFCSMGDLIAQRARYKPQTHEISLQLGSMHMVFDPVASTVNAYPFDLQVVNGIQYTYHYSISDGFRLGAQLREGYFDLIGPTDTRILLDKRNWEVNLGYERKIHFGAVQLFGGGDLMFSAQELDFKVGGAGADSQFENSTLAGIAAFGGVGRFFSPHLSLSLETKLMYLHQLQEEVQATKLPVPFVEDGELNLQVAVSLNIHLVKMKKRCTCPKFRR